MTVGCIVANFFVDDLLLLSGYLRSCLHPSLIPIADNFIIMHAYTMSCVHAHSISCPKYEILINVIVIVLTVTILCHTPMSLYGENVIPTNSVLYMTSGHRPVLSR